MTNERIIELLEIEKECVLRNACGECNRACHICELVQDDTELHEMYAEVIARMKAQEPEVPNWKDGHAFCGKCGIQFWNGYRYCPECGRSVKWTTR